MSVEVRFMRQTTLFSLVFSAVVASGCAAEGGEDGPLVEPPIGEGKSDVQDHVVYQGPLAYGEAASSRFIEDLEFHGYSLFAKPGAKVTLEITRQGSSRSIDTTLFVYGPRNESGAFGSASIVRDDNDGYAKLSKIGGFVLREGGEYMVVVGTKDALGRGDYRVLATCESGDCAPPAPPPPPAEAGCHPVLERSIRACMDGHFAEEEWFYSTTRRAIVEGCADAEVIAAGYDAHCASGGRDALCDRTFEQLSEVELPACRESVWNTLLDGLCVFGDRYRDIFEPGAFTILGRRDLQAGSTVTPLEREQTILAVRASAHEPNTYEEAVAAADRDTVFQTRLWDKSNHREFTVYELGAGDNSFGLFFAAGTTNVVARIGDSDIYECTVNWGDEARECRANVDCRNGAMCEGATAEIGIGRCVARREAHPATDTACGSQSDCPMNTGLICQGASMGGDGLCRPAWQQSYFVNNPGQAIPDNNRTGADTTLLAYGLASVPTDALIDQHISHPRIKDLQVQLLNPSGTASTVFSGERDGTELYLDGFPVAVPGDESANGVWTLRVVDTRRGQTGTIQRFGLRITSRWD
jgi:hypothetical protein